jgi:uncharacterized Zn finger protein
MDAALAALLNVETLRRLAGSASFRRGEDYFDEGSVESLQEDRGVIVARVIGTKPYQAKLWADGKTLAYSCTCPVADDGEFCKHLVAVGLSARAGTLKPAKNERKPKLTLKDVRAYLEGEEKGALVQMLLETADWDPALRDQLLLKTAKSRHRGGPDVAALKEAIDSAVYPGHYVGWEEAAGYSNGVAAAVETIEDILKDGHAGEALDLSEHALRGVEEVMQSSVDDSDGFMGGLLERLQEIHHAACKEARPDPVALAKRLFAWEMRTGFDTFYRAVETYADVLGKDGLAEYRKLAEAQWKRLPPLQANESDGDKHPRRFRVTSIMERLAEQAGDVDARVAVMSKDLAHAYGYLKIAELYRDANRHDAALDWAERGLRAFPQRTDRRLREFLADEYHRRERHEDAMALIWKEFVELPGLDVYKKLKSHADRTESWTAWRERALASLREGDTQKESSRLSRWFRRDHSTLVQVFLWENDVEAAWAEAKAGGCSDDLWMALAEKREKEHPADALAVYQSQVGRILRHASNRAYAEAVGLIRRIQKVMVEAGAEGEFAVYLASVRATHKAKRNLMRLLDRARWG